VHRLAHHEEVVGYVSPRSDRLREQAEADHTRAVWISVARIASRYRGPLATAALVAVGIWRIQRTAAAVRRAGGHPWT
jgi:hypothetical protein